MANPQIVKTPNPFTPVDNTKQAGNKAIIGFSRFRPIGRVFQNTAVKIVHLLTILSLPASGWPGPRCDLRAASFARPTDGDAPTEPYSGNTP